MKELDDPRMLPGFRLHESDHADGRKPGSGTASSPHPRSIRQQHSGSGLQVLAEQLSGIADELRRASSLSGDSQAKILMNLADASPNRGRAETALGFSGGQSRRTANAEAAKNLYARRRRRATLFGNAELFGEPAWDILLDLYVAHAENKAVSVSSACIGSASPPTTGLRWLGVLAENDLILREHDPEDQRRVLVRLTDRGLAAMDDYFNAITPAD